jgi:REP element-mobilizing transposase RayT
VREVRRTLVAACERGEFRVAHYSIQRDHVHMIVEARGREALARGMKSVAARLARAVNRVFSRSGPVLDGRFHHRVLRTPREVRNALAYVLLNARRHFAKRSGGRRPPVRLDAASSARCSTAGSRRGVRGSGHRVKSRARHARWPRRGPGSYASAGGATGSWTRARCLEFAQPPSARVGDSLHKALAPFYRPVRCALESCCPTNSSDSDSGH